MLLRLSLLPWAALGLVAVDATADEKAPARPAPDYVKVEMRGTLYLPPSGEAKGAPARLAVRSGDGRGQKRYELELPPGKALRVAAGKLNGKAVVVTGELVTVFDFVQSATRPYPPRDVVRVKTLKRAEPEK